MMIIILENIGDICVSADFLHRNPFKNPDKKRFLKTHQQKQIEHFSELPKLFLLLLQYM